MSAALGCCDRSLDRHHDQPWHVAELVILSEGDCRGQDADDPKGAACFGAGFGAGFQVMVQLVSCSPNGAS